jgi:hypothetical protein
LEQLQQIIGQDIMFSRSRVKVPGSLPFARSVINLIIDHVQAPRLEAATRQLVILNICELFC